MDIILVQTKDGTKVTNKLEILRAFQSFDLREPDKTMSLWQDLAHKLYLDYELSLQEVQ